MIHDNKFNKKEFFKSFTDIKNIANISIIKCYKIVLTIKNLTNNYGFYIIGSIMFLYLITFIIYRFISYKKLKKDLFNLSIILNKISQIKVQPENLDNKTSIKKITKKSKGKRKIKNNKTNKDNIIDINIKNNNEIKYSNNVIETI